MTVRRETDGTARLVFGRVELRAADGVILASLAVFSLLAVAGRAVVERWPLLVARNLCVGVAVLISAAVTPRIRRPLPVFLLRTATVTLSYAYLFGAVAGLQLILHGRFQDDLVLAFERSLFGVQPTLWMERFITPSLTEWMMFCYVIYIPFYPLLCAILWVKRGEEAAEECFFTLGLANVLCDPASSSSPWPARCTGCRTGTACRFTAGFSPGWGSSSGHELISRADLSRALMPPPRRSCGSWPGSTTVRRSGSSRR